MASVLVGHAPEQRSRLLIAVALVFAAIAAVLVFVALQNRDDSAGASGSAAVAGTTSVVVAANDLPANTLLDTSMLELRALPPDAVLEGAFADSAALAGMATRFPVSAGEQITPIKVGLNQIENRDDVSQVLPQGMRAFAVKVAEVTGAGGLLLPGNFVDVIAVFPETSNGETTSPARAVTLLQDVELIAVGQEAQEPYPAQADGESTGLSGRRPDGVERQPDAQSATLAVSPEDARLLALVQESGAAIWLSMRPAGDHETVDGDETVLEPAVPAARESTEE
ncbi:MAG: Flp pilus assembly protein CpaB [Dehalococcoidia bacterium]